MPNYEELKKKLLNNIKAIQKVVPEFNLTEDQIESMFSTDRVNLNKKAREYLESRIPEDLANRKVEEYIPGGKLPAGMRRLYYYLLRSDGTAESDLHNRTLFEGLTRDDEVGDEKRTGAYLYVLNRILHSGDDLFKYRSEEELFEYTVNHMEELQCATERRLFINAFNQFTVRDKQRVKLMDMVDLSTETSGISAYPEYAASEEFLTMPLSYLTDEQFQQLKGASIFDNNEEQKNFISAYSNYSNIRKLNQRINEGYVPEKHSDFTKEDVTYTEPVEKRYFGGYVARKDLAQTNLRMLRNVFDLNSDPVYADVKSAAMNCLISLRTKDIFPDETEKNNICNAFSKLKSVIRVLRSSEILNTFPKGKEVLQSISGAFVFDDPGVLNALTGYALADSRKGNETEQLNQSLKELNEEMSVLDLSDAELTQMEILSLRSKTAEVLRNADSILNSDDKELKNNGYAQAIRKNMHLLMRNLNRASAGEKLNQIREGSIRDINVTGRDFHKEGGNQSTRFVMKIVGNDGNPVNGYFTEEKTLNHEIEKARFANKLYKAYPQMKDAADRLMEVYFKDYLDPAEQEEARHELAERYGNTPELNKLIKDSEQFGRKVRSVTGLSMQLLTQGNTRIDLRNVAFSDTAELFGCGDIVAKATQMIMYDKGVPTKGTFMEKVEGDDLHHVKDGKGRHFLDAGEDLLDHTPALKQMADLQTLDFICGNADRHPGNMIYRFNDQGKIIGIKGIDNDFSFPGCALKDYRMPRTVTIEKIKYVSKSMMEKLNKVTGDMLRTVLFGNRLTQMEIQRTTERLQELKEAVKDGRIAVMEDADFAKHKLTDFITNKPNVFSEVKDDIKTCALSKTAEEKEQLRNIIAEENNGETVAVFKRVSNSALSMDVQPLSSIIDSLEDARKHVWGGSEAYDHVQRYFERIRLSIALFRREGKQASIRTLESMNEVYATAEEKCSIYLAKKEREGRLNAGGKTGRRIRAVKEALLYCRNRRTDLEMQINESQVQKQTDQQMKEIFRSDPASAGQVIRSYLNAADNGNEKDRRNAAVQISKALRFMKESGTAAETAGLSNDELKKAKELVLAAEKDKQQMKHPVLSGMQR